MLKLETSLKKGLTPKIRMLCFVIRNNAPFNVLFVRILFLNASSHCFRFLLLLNGLVSVFATE